MLLGIHGVTPVLQEQAKLTPQQCAILVHATVGYCKEMQAVEAERQKLAEPLMQVSLLSAPSAVIMTALDCCHVCSSALNILTWMFSS